MDKGSSLERRCPTPNGTEFLQSSVPCVIVRVSQRRNSPCGALAREHESCQKAQQEVRPKPRGVVANGKTKAKACERGVTPTEMTIAITRWTSACCGALMGSIPIQEVSPQAFIDGPDSTLVIIDVLYHIKLYWTTPGRASSPEIYIPN